MTYLYGYLGIGAVFLAVICISHQLTKTRDAVDIDDLIQSVDPQRDRWWWKPLNNVVVPILAAALALTAWPIAVYWKAKEIVDARGSADEEPPKEFAVTKEHLRKQCTVADIEEAEIVVDPLGAVPMTPFGHLNPVWETFRKSILEDDQLWSFSAHWTTEWGRTEIRDGYVIVRGEMIGPHFLAHWVLDDSESK